MTCDLDRVDALADGRLDGPEAKEVMEHLAGCPQCRAYYEGALAADRVLSFLTDMERLGFEKEDLLSLLLQESEKE